ncbi:hypothetical protein MN608_10819 [Microdochium nivale]|nr:hypothetical protein MN608_10819 [Microdochium nivale]
MALSHISIGVSSADFHPTRAFLTAALAPLGLRLVFDNSDSAAAAGKIRCLGFGPNDTSELLNVFDYGAIAQAPGPGHHIAFEAPTREAVLDFYTAGMGHGGICGGPPGLRPHFGANYYAAFIFAPGGWKIEAVCKAAGEDA